jgi:uncharacterized protein YdeI (BOF family)
MHKTLLSLFFLLIVTAGQTCFAATTPARVTDLNGSFVPGDRVELKGRFLSKVNFETLLFEDETGRIEVILDDHQSVSSRLLDPASLILVRGEVASGFQQTAVVLCDAIEVLSYDPSAIVQNVASAAKGEGLPGRKDLDRNKALKNSCADSVANQDVAEIDTVNEVLNDGCLGQEVTIIGSFVEQVNYETLLFRDRTGDIEVVFSDEDMFSPGQGSSFGPVQLTGEVVRGYRNSILIAFVDLKKSLAKD